MTALNQKFATTFSEVTDERAACAKELWQQGRRKEAKDLLAKIKADQAIWLTLSSQAQAGVLRLDASISLDSGHDPDRAEQLLSEAMRLCPGPEDDRIRAEHPLEPSQLRRGSPIALADRRTRRGASTGADARCVGPHR